MHSGTWNNSVIIFSRRCSITTRCLAILVSPPQDNARASAECINASRVRRGTNPTGTAGGAANAQNDAPLLANRVQAMWLQKLLLCWCCCWCRPFALAQQMEG